MCAQSIVGTWKSIDEKTNKDESILEIYQENGQFYGKVIQILDAKKRNVRCEKCKGKTIVKGENILKIEIKKGMKHGDAIVFREESDQEPGKIAGDIIVRI